MKGESADPGEGGRDARAPRAEAREPASAGIEVRHFGPGYRKTNLPRSKRMEACTLHSGDGTVVSELHLRSWAEIEAHTAPHPILFVVIQGSGFVGVGGEERAVTRGMAVLWPAGVPHRAWTHGQEMTGIAIEMSAAPERTGEAPGAAGAAAETQDP